METIDEAKDYQCQLTRLSKCYAQLKEVLSELGVRYIPFCDKPPTGIAEYQQEIVEMNRVLSKYHEKNKLIGSVPPHKQHEPRVDVPTYLVTITTKEGDDPCQCIAAYKLLKSYTSDCQAVLEMTKEGRPHIHAVVEMKDKGYFPPKLKPKLFREAGNSYVDVRILKTKSDVERSIQYIHKSESKPTVEYRLKWDLKKYGL